MDNKDFDNIVKEQMNNLQVAPSEGVKKALAGAMFYRNLWFFHKVKLITALLAVSGGTYLGLTYSSQEEGQLTNNAGSQEHQQNSPQTNLEDNQLTANAADQQELINPEAPESSSFEMGSGVMNEEDVLNQNEPNSDASVTNDYSLNTMVNEKGMPSSVNEKTANTEGTRFENGSEDNGAMTNASSSNFTSKSADASSQEANNSTAQGTQYKSAGVSESFDVVRNNSQLDYAVTNPAEILESIEVKGKANLTKAEKAAMPNPEDYVYEKPIEGLSFDVYYSPYNMTDIDNSLDANLEEYWWDFYQEFDYVRTANNIGVNVNYDWRNLRLGTGIATSTLYDYKPVYEYLYDDYTFAPLGGHVISGAMVYGQENEQDTALIFYVDPADQKLIDEFESDYNSFTYLKIPLTLGYKLDMKYASLEVNGGIEWNRLMRAKGQSVKIGQPADESFPIYFYEDRYMTSFSKNREVLNKNILGVTASATLRVRLNPHFDLYSSANFNQGKQGVYVNDYFLQKTYRNYGLKFGLTYYISKRLTVPELTNAKF